MRVLQFVKLVLSKPNDEDQTEGSSHRTDTAKLELAARQLLTRFFSMFKDYLEKKLEDKGFEQIEQKSKMNKEV